MSIKEKINVEYKTALKSKDKNIQIACTDSQGSSMYNYFTSGNLEKKGDPSFTEGIGQARITKT